MAVKDGLGPRPVAQSAKHYFLSLVYSCFCILASNFLFRASFACYVRWDCPSFLASFFELLTLHLASLSVPPLACPATFAETAPPFSLPFLGFLLCTWLPFLSPPRLPLTCTAQHLLLVISSLTRSPCCRQGSADIYLIYIILIEILLYKIILGYILYKFYKKHILEKLGK